MEHKFRGCQDSDEATFPTEGNSHGLSVTDLFESRRKMRFEFTDRQSLHEEMIAYCDKLSSMAAVIFRKD
jgi:hypothetical protein